MSSTSTVPSQITVNGAARPRANLQLVSDLIAELNLDAKKVAIERNLAIVPRSAYASTPIMDGDAIEIVGFIGGG
jgi:thiamine biosynthesis protein ThiS